MSQPIEFRKNLADALTAEGSRVGLSLADYAVRNGLELVAFWRTEGVIGCRPDNTPIVHSTATFSETRLM